MLLVFVFVLLAGCSPVQTEGKFTALRFGQTTGDYVQLSSNIMDESTSQFSVCTWLRKRLRAGSAPIVLLYHTEPGSGDIHLGDNGFYNHVVGPNLDLQSEFTVPDRQWFHVCWTWSTEDYTLTVYLNGEEIGSKATYQRELHTGGGICLGNLDSQTSDLYPSDYIFGGDMFKLNIYSRLLSQYEIRTMASDICSSTEDKLTAITILRWEEIIINPINERTGNVTEILMDCYDYEHELELLRNQTQQRLELIEERLNSTQEELNSTQEELNSTQEELNSTQEELNITKQEMTETKTQLENVVTKKKDNEGLYLTVTIVFGVISTISLILALTALLLKLVTANRSNQAVVMSRVARQSDSVRGEEHEEAKEETEKGAGAGGAVAGTSDDYYIDNTVVIEETYDNHELYNM